MDKDYCIIKVIDDWDDNCFYLTVADRKNNEHEFRVDTDDVDILADYLHLPAKYMPLDLEFENLNEDLFQFLRNASSS